jgi:hypothetical protein
MRLEIEAAEVGRALPDRRLIAGTVKRTRRRPDRFDVGVLLAFAAVSMWVVGLDVWQVVAHDRVWTGTDGFYVVDQMQYLAWIRDASHHLLASNLFVLRSTPIDYFQPAVAISGGLSAVGLAPWLSLLVWKPVAVISAFYAIRAYARRSLSGLWSRRAVLVLGLFFGSFSIIYGSVGVVGDLLPGFLSWGYTFGLIAVAAMIAALVAYDRSRVEQRRRWAPALLGVLASSMHPWQGELLILIVLGAEGKMWLKNGRAQRGAALPVLTLLATGIPLLYYLVLGHADLSWQLARNSSQHGFSFWTIGLAVAPLALPAILGYRRRSDTFLDAATRAWPIAACVVFVLSATGLSSAPLHAFEGITVPLAVLAVRGVRGTNLRRIRYQRLLGSLAVAAATIPATAFQLNEAPPLVAPSAGNANFITRDERQALDYLDRAREPGGVITRFYLGAVVPAETGRRTFVGDCLWSEPDCSDHAKIAQDLFDGTLDAETAKTFVLATHARFVLADCQAQSDLTIVLGPVIRSVRRFGCATVYSVE